MVDAWGPAPRSWNQLANVVAQHPTEPHVVKPIAADGVPGEVTEQHPRGREPGPKPNENYDATDGRHNKADHQGWPSVDSRSGYVDDQLQSTRRFPDGPGVWRQT